MAGPVTTERGDASYEAVHAPLLRFLPELVRALGGDPATLPRTGRRSAALTYRQLAALLEGAAHDLGHPDFGMRLAVRQGGVGAFGPLGEAMRRSRTFGDALTYVTTHIYAHSLAARVWLKKTPSGRSVFSGHDILVDRLPNRGQMMEHVMLLGQLGARELTGGRVSARAAHFRHQPISSPRVYRQYFGCEVRFGQLDDGLIFAIDDLACPIVDSDAGALEQLTAYIDRHFTRQRPPLHAEVRGLAMRLLWSGECSNERVAAQLGLHPRTLHRRLGEEGTSFQRIKDEVRRDVLAYYLGETDLDGAAITERLGFAEQSVMTRFCSRMLGAPPTAIRARSRHATKRVPEPA